MITLTVLKLNKKQSKKTNVRLAICANVIGVQSQIGAAAVTNTGIASEDVPNTAEVEQETEQNNECTDALLCANVIGAQSQIGGLAAVTNAGVIEFDDAEVTNSAEVEQETEQSNECGLAICANVIGVQSQVGAAAVTNAAVATFDDAEVTNSAEVEQETEQIKRMWSCNLR